MLIVCTYGAIQFVDKEVQTFACLVLKIYLYNTSTLRASLRDKEYSKYVVFIAMHVE